MIMIWDKTPHPEKCQICGFSKLVCQHTLMDFRMGAGCQMRVGQVEARRDLAQNENRHDVAKQMGESKNAKLSRV